MAEKKNKNSLILCIFACAIPFICYGTERLVYHLSINSSSVMLALAFSFTALTGLLYFIISKIDNPVYGLLSSVLAFKLMPPEISRLMHYSFEGQAIYSIVSMAALVLFATLIVKHFRKQDSDGVGIKVLPVVVLVFAMLILRQPSLDLYTSLYALQNQSLYGVYFAQAAIYLWVSAIILVTTYKSSYSTIKFITTFQIIAMSFNIARRLGTVIVGLINGSHISASYYCWILIYVVVMIAFELVLKKAEKKKA